jgi:hypothetical protein
LMKRLGFVPQNGCNRPMPPVIPFNPLHSLEIEGNPARR